ncbi:hypothetical protein B0H14DRAFT_3458272 [Mycena olivaceomarginata]|nr:hypothetical protein B0H14DRAFT_3458272 [Mycena olivaceomarginata]
MSADFLVGLDLCFDPGILWDDYGVRSDILVRASLSFLTPSYTSDARLPPELERVIFETAALANVPSIPTLMLVASRVKCWVEPLLYRVVGFPDAYVWENCGFPIFTLDILLEVIATKPPEFLENAIKHVYFDIPLPLSPTPSIYRAFSGVINVFDRHNFFSLATGEDVVGRFSHLQRLAMYLDAFISSTSTRGTPSILAGITHLELTHTFNNYSMENLPAYLSLLPHLTHIDLMSIENDPLMRTAFCENTHLQCIVFLVAVYTPEGDPLPDDDRVVCLEQEKDFRLDWLRGTRTGKDFWVVADEFIVARREGRVDRSRFPIKDTDAF